MGVTLTFLAALQTVPASPAEPAALTVADMAGEAIQLAPTLLAPEQARRVVRANVRRVFAPGTTFSAAFYLMPRRLAPDLCEARQFRIQLNGTPSNSLSAPDMRLVPGPISELVHYAVINPSDAACPLEGGYIDLIDGVAGERQLHAYRRLLEAMRRARQGNSLRFAIDCQSDAPSDCANPRAALANLPLPALFGIYVVGRRVRSPQGYDTTAPIAPGDPYDVEISFGMSGPDGNSWRVRWRETGEGMPHIRMQRTMVVYH